MERARERLEQHACYKLSYTNHALLFDCFFFANVSRKVAIPIAIGTQSFTYIFSRYFFAKAD